MGFLLFSSIFYGRLILANLIENSISVIAGIGLFS